MNSFHSCLTVVFCVVIVVFCIQFPSRVNLGKYVAVQGFGSGSCSNLRVPMPSVDLPGERDVCE